MHPVGYLYEDYHDARSLEHKVQTQNVRKQIRYASVQAADNRAQLTPYSHCDRHLIYDLCILG